MALAQLGRAVVRQGRVEEGVALLDEAMTVALGGETSDPLACGDACCTTLVVCDGLADLERAAQWCEAVVEFTERRRFTPVQSWCRGIYGAVLVRAGDWERAEAVLAEALQRQRGPPPGRRPRAAAGRARRAAPAPGAQRGGRAAARPASRTSPPRSPPLVQLHLQRGDLRARAGAARPPRRDGGDGELLALRGAVALAAGDLDGRGGRGRAPARRSPSASRARTCAPRRRCSPAASPRARGDAAAAARELEDAVAGFAALRFPLEEARARLRSRASRPPSGSPLALAAARAARDAFERLGARRDADRGGRAAARARRRGPHGACAATATS